MFSMLRFVALLVLLTGMTWCTFTVKLGERTTAQHIHRIWSAPETQELVEGVEEKAGPVIDKVKRGVEAGVREAASSDQAQDAKAAAEAEAKRRAAEAAKREAASQLDQLGAP
jgi:biopolymer transport protein ExbB/TolQ